MTSLKQINTNRKNTKKSTGSVTDKEEDPKINFKFNQVKKVLNCGMGFVNPYKSINQNSLGSSQSWRFKKTKKV